MSWSDPIATVDASVLGLLHASRSPALDAFFAAATWAGSMWILLPLAAVLAVLHAHASRGRQALALPAALGLTWGGVHLVKLVVDRARPDAFGPLVAMPVDASFPSAHTAQAAAFAVSLWWTLGDGPRGRRTGFALAAAAFVAVVALSRLYLQVHFLSDVLAGALLGGATALAVMRVMLPRQPAPAAP